MDVELTIEHHIDFSDQEQVYDVIHYEVVYHVLNVDQGEDDDMEEYNIN